MKTSHLFQETETCTAHYYIDEMGYELTREEFLAQLLEYRGYMLYVGEGYVPLTVAVLTYSARKYDKPGEASEAEEAFEEWARRNDRLAEIGEDDKTPESEWGQYQCHAEELPCPVILMPAELADLQQRAGLYRSL